MVTLYLAVGIPASSKTTTMLPFAKEHGYIYLSSDSLRAILGSGESDQNVNAEVFQMLQSMAAYFFSIGFSVVLDATNCSTRNRTPFINIARRYNAKVVAYHFQISLEEAKRRNAARARVVPEIALDKFHWTLERQPPTIGEVDEIRVIEAK